MSSNEKVLENKPDAALEEDMHRSCHRRRMWKIPFIVAAIILVKSGIVFYLWNALIPDLFHGPTLTFVQTIGLVVLAKLLLGFGHGPFGHHRHHRGHERFRARWAKLSPEERTKLREALHKRHHRHD